MFRPEVKRVLLLVIGAIECLFFGGWIFGWASLVFVFKQEGYFSDECTTGSSTVVPENRTGSPGESPTTTLPVTVGNCEEQDRQLQLVFTVANFCVAGAAFPLGLMFDKLGTLFMRILISVLMFAGSLMFGLSSSSRAFLVFPAAVCVSMGGVQLLVVNLQISNLFGRHKWFVMAIFCGCFDSSAVVFLIVKALYENLNVPIQSVFYVMTSTTFFFTFNTFFLLPKRAHIPWPPVQDEYHESSGTTQELSAVETKHVYSNDVNLKDENLRERYVHSGDSDTDHREQGASNQTTNEMPNTLSSTDNEVIESNPLSKDFPSLRSCFFSLSFLFFYFWFSILQLQVLFFVSTLNPVLTRLADNDETIVSKYTNALAFIQLGGIVCAPFSGLLLSRNKGRNRCKNKETETERLKQRGPYSDLKDASIVYAISTSIAIVFYTCSVMPFLEVQYATFVLSVFSRSFVYSLTASGTNLLFPGKYFGAVYGLMIGLSAVFSLLQYPLFIVAQDVFDGDDFWIKIGLLSASVLTYSFSIFIFFYSRRKEKALKNQIQEEAVKNADQEYNSVYL
ncbi:equilibrative nucleobase transporter 1-like [Asterias amurensis]|uniref:equilibrative nucleobase transporter 1-like n=1 Tax=Asterias amurensis TaxID=7602 RepID=UPI003AB5BE93